MTFSTNSHVFGLEQQEKKMTTLHEICIDRNGSRTEMHVYYTLSKRAISLPAKKNLSVSRALFKEGAATPPLRVIE